ncbi:MAG: MerR family transcriptional regulator [Actinomycetota bacterium]|nr:MerR family transcriptional regulator [Actinomycetota bacterium]MDP2288128.1 MerR family transcriptional regulator [Actinomycetota bacterium]
MTAKTPHEPDLVQIGVLAERVGLSMRTVRYYEEVGLVVPSTRSPGGFRLFGPAEEERLRVLKTLKPLGFSLEEMRNLVQILDAVTKADAATRAKLLKELTSLHADLDQRRTRLQQQLKSADELSHALQRAEESLDEFRQASQSSKSVESVPRG